MNLFGIFKKDINTVVALFDIGSGSVEGALVMFSKTHMPEVLYTYKEEIKFKRRKDPQTQALFMEEVYARVALTVRDEGLKKIKLSHPKNAFIDQVRIIFASPWTAHFMRSVVIEKDKDFVITRESFNEVLKKEQKSVLEEANNDWGGKPVCIESQILSTSLNGYITDKPFSKKTRKAQFSLLFGCCDNSIISKTKEISKRIFGEQILIGQHTFILSAFTVLRDVFIGAENSLVADIGSEVTEIFMMRDNAISESVSFPYGKNSLIRDIMEGLKLEEELARSALRAYHKGDISEDDKKTHNAINTALAEWVGEFEKAVESLNTALALPHVIFVLADADAGNVFAESIADENVAKFLLAEDSFKRVVVDRFSFSNRCVFQGEASNDPFIAIDTLFIDKLVSNSNNN